MIDELKVYFLCEKQREEWYVCYGVLSNGFVFGSHVCSGPGWAPGDLYFTRMDRIAALKELFGVAPSDRSKTETFVLERPDDEVPDWWHLVNDNYQALQPFYAAYKDRVGDTRAQIEIELDD